MHQPRPPPTSAPSSGVKSGMTNFEFQVAVIAFFITVCFCCVCTALVAYDMGKIQGWRDAIDQDVHWRKK